MTPGMETASRPAVAERPQAAVPVPVRSTPTPAPRGAGPIGNAASARQVAGPMPTVDLAAEKIGSPELDSYVAGGGTRGTEVHAILGSVAHGPIVLHKHRSGLSTDGVQQLPIQHAQLGLLEPLRPVVGLVIEHGKRSRIYVSTAAAPKASTGLIEAIDKSPSLLGLVGVDLSRFPKPITEIVGGELSFKLTGIAFGIGSLVKGSLDVGFTGPQPVFRATGAVTLPKGQAGPAQLVLERDAKGDVRGSIDVPIALGKVTGNVTAAFGPAGVFQVRGVLGVQMDKFGGEITVMVADAATAREAALAQLGVTAVEAAADEAKKPSAKAKPGAMAVIGWGTLNFAVSEWLAGKAQVIVDDEGHLTVMGEITPPAEVILFEQRDYIRNLFKLEARAAYGVPYVGNIFVFANVGLDAMAKFGPGKLYAIKLSGKYSTNPKVAKAFSIEGTLNISAFAGVRLRGEGGAGIEILSHDIKMGVGVNGLGGVRGYVQATPKIGMREVGDPKEGKKTEFFLNGHMEIAAQPFLGLGGDFFVELDSPWWSPAPDKKWTWPLGQLEYPLPGQFGLGVDLDWVIGSPNLPEVKTGEVSFDAKNFMTDLVDDKVPPKSKGDQEKPGAWKDGPEAVPAPDPKAAPDLVKPAGGGPKAQAADGPTKEGKDHKGAVDKANVPKDLSTAKKFGEGSEELARFSALSHRHPMSHKEVNREADILLRRYGFRTVEVKRDGSDWLVKAAINPVKEERVSALAEEARDEIEALGSGSPSDVRGESFPDPAKRQYRGGLRPDDPVRDHIFARAAGGPDVESNIDIKSRESNAVKGGREGALLRYEAALRAQGLTQEQVRSVTGPEWRSIRRDVHAVSMSREHLEKIGDSDQTVD